MPTAPSSAPSFPFVRHLAAAILMIGLMPSIAPEASAASANCCKEQPVTADVTAEVLVEGIAFPWGIDFLPDGSLLITGMRGDLWRYADGKLSEPFDGLPEVIAKGQGGLLDVAVDPDFTTTGHIFFTYVEASKDRRGLGTAVGRGTLDITEAKVKETDVIFRANNKTAGARHFGSRIALAPDRTMYVTLGERGKQKRAQDPFDHPGSVIRINRDGSVPLGNPYADGKKGQPEIWAIGFRNQQGATIHPETGELWTLSHGADGGDELNRPKAGLNYGWPLISYGKNNAGHGFELGTAADGLEQPHYHWDQQIAPSGLTFYMPQTPLIPAWKGSLLLGGLTAQTLVRLILDADGEVVAEERYFVGEFGRIRDVATGPDGAVWMVTNGPDSKLIRVTGAQ